MARALAPRASAFNEIAVDGDLTLPSLTPREREIVQLLAEVSSRGIASQLNLRVRTVETHRSNLMRKLNLHSISELVLYAVRNNMVQVMPLFDSCHAFTFFCRMSSPLRASTMA